MNKPVLIALGLVCAGAAAFAAGWWPSAADLADGPAAGFGGARTTGYNKAGDAGEMSVEARLTALEDALAIERQARQVLEDEIFVLHEGLARLDGPSGTTAPGSAPVSSVAAASDPAESTTRRSRRRGRMDREGRRERLAEVGFSSAEAERILQRESELQMETIQLRYEAERNGESFSYRNRANMLRSELGDESYARYLEAYGRPSSVSLTNVYENSPAMTAGLRPGDEIVRYDGQRVFSMNEISSISLDGAAGENVIIDVLRDGTPMQFSMPRGPLGVAGGRRRR